MHRAFRQGHLEIDFPAKPFDAALPLLSDTVRVFCANLPFLAAATLIVYLPGKLANQLLCYLLDIPFEGVGSYLMLEASDLVLSSLLVPAIVFGLVDHMRSGKTPALAECLRWGRRQWGRTFWNQTMVEVTVTLWAALLIVPGIAAMMRLAYTDVIVAVEADLERDALGRSTQLTQGRRWRIFAVMLPLLLLSMAATFLVLDRIQAATHSRIAFAMADTVLAVPAQLTTVAVLLMYLGTLPKGTLQEATLQKRVTKLKP